MATTSNKFEQGYIQLQQYSHSNMERVSIHEHELRLHEIKTGDYVDIHRNDTDKDFWRIIKVSTTTTDGIIGTLIGDKYSKKYRRTNITST